jgi:transglutaminase/protease-like cytokinesis protein 3
MKSLLLVVLALVLGLSSPVADVEPKREDYDHYLLSLKRLLWRDNRDDTIRTVHDYLVLTVDYSHKDEGNAYQAIVEKETNCKGYAEAMHDLLGLWGFDCEVVYGIYNGELHAWNHVKFSDGWYYVDVSLDDTGDGLISTLYYKQKELETHYQIYKEEEK